MNITYYEMHNQDSCGRQIVFQRVMSTIAPNNHAYGMFKNILIQHHTVISLEETGPTCREGNGVAIVFGYLNKFTVTVYEAWLRFTSTANSTLLHMGS